MLVHKSPRANHIIDPKVRFVSVVYLSEIFHLMPNQRRETGAAKIKCAHLTYTKPRGEHGARPHQSHIRRAFTIHIFRSSCYVEVLFEIPSVYTWCAVE